MNTATPEEVAQNVKDFAAQYLHGEKGGLIGIAVCDVCGWMVWLSTRKQETLEVAPESMQMWGRSCPMCTEIEHRAPEIFHWVKAVVRQAQLDMAVGTVNVSKETA